MSQLDKLYSKSRFHRLKEKEHPQAPTLYGEITRVGVDAILEEFSPYFDQNCVFYDLGCGEGKMVMHVSMGVSIKRSVGIEYYKERCDIAKESSLDYNYLTEPEFINGDIFRTDISDATVVYVDDTKTDFAKMIAPYLEKMLRPGCLIIWRHSLVSRDLKEGEILAPTTYDDNKKAYWRIKK